MKQLKIVFMGTPDFAVGVLKELHKSQHQIVGVITAPDKPAGRGRKLRKSAVKEYAESHDLLLLQPTNLKDETFLEELAALNADLQVVVAFRMLPEKVWNMPPMGTFNLHASLLPQYRGAAPINWAVINGEEITGVTTFFIDDKIDTGAIIMSREVAINKGETAGSLHDRLMEVGSHLVVDTVDAIAKDEVTATIQPNIDTLKPAPKLDAENTRINWKESGEKVEALIRGLYPFPVAWTTLSNNDDDQKIKVHSGSFTAEDHDLIPGTVLSTKKTLKIAVSDGYINIEMMQLPGKRKMEIKELLNGYAFNPEAKVF